MDWFKIIQSTIDHIEGHLTDDIEIDKLASFQYVSDTDHRKMFSLICECTMSEYIRNRRLTLAAYELLNSDVNILELALRYGYQSNESFTRAFTRFHHVTPIGIKKGQRTMRIFSKMIVEKKLTGGKMMLNDLSKRGYVIKETGSVYYTKDMDKTVAWFQEILGWYGQIEARDEEGVGSYGCVNNIPTEIEALHIAPFTGIHLFNGEPIKQMIGFMLVEGIDQLYDFVTSKGWHQITQVVKEPWNGRTCSVTTIDGSILKFFEI